MTEKNKNNQVLILGGGRRGLATIEVLNDNNDIDITVVIDINQQAAGIRLAERLGIPTDTDWEKYIKDAPPPDAVLNLTDDPLIQEKLFQLTQKKDIEIMGNLTANLLSNLLMERQVQLELHRVSQRITSDVGLEELMVLILSSCVKSTKADGGIIIIFDENTSQWEVKSNWAIPEDIEKLLLYEASKRLPTWTEEKEVSELNGIQKTGNIREDIKNTLWAPLKSHKNIIGTIILSKKDITKKFSANAKRLLSTFANQSAVAIENILLYKKTQYLSVTDGLTGVYNHRYFQEQMQIELTRAQRYDLNFSLIMIDIDNFKEINDTYGHLTGDDILRKVTKHLKNEIREADSISRYGGDEFVILLPETTKEQSFIVGERIRSSLISKKIGGEISVHISVGISAYPDDGVYSQDIINKADSALYKAKENGRNRTCLS